MPYSNVSRRKVTHFNEGEREERERENERRKRKEKVVEREREGSLSLHFLSVSPFPRKPLSSFPQDVLVAHCATLRRLSLFLQRGAFLVFAPHPPGGSQQQIANSFVFAPSAGLCEASAPPTMPLTIGKRAILPPSQPPTR